MRAILLDTSTHKVYLRTIPGIEKLSTNRLRQIPFHPCNHWHQRQRSGLAIRRGGIGLKNFVETAPFEYDNLCHMYDSRPEKLLLD